MYGLEITEKGYDIWSGLHRMHICCMDWVGIGTTSMVTGEEDGENDGVGKCEMGNVDAGGVKLMALTILNVNVDEMDEEWGWVGNGGMEIIVKSFWWKRNANS